MTRWHAGESEDEVAFFTVNRVALPDSVIADVLLLQVGQDETTSDRLAPGLSEVCGSCEFALLMTAWSLVDRMAGGPHELPA
jgi:hypothetical protein